MRVTWLTDLHLNLVDRREMMEFVATLKREAPEVVLVTGDTAESVDVMVFVEQLAEVAPVYFVLGNHDFYRSTIAEVRRRAAATKRWLPAAGPVRLTPATTLVGVDGWATPLRKPRVTVKTGGWMPGQRDYGNPIVQATWSVA